MSSSSKVWVIIPARYNSNRLPGKPLLTLGGKPIFSHVITRAMEAGVAPARIVIATDDVRIAEHASQLGHVAIMTSHLHESGSDRVLEAAEKLGVNNEDLVVNLQGDEPFVPSELVAKLISYAKDSEFAISTASVSIDDESEFLNANSVKVVVGAGGRALYFSRSPVPFSRGHHAGFSVALRHIGIYCYRMSALKRFCLLKPPALESMEKLEQLRALYYGMEIGCIVYDGYVPYGVDTHNEYQNLVEIYGV